MTVAIDRATGKRRGDRAPRPGPVSRLKRGYQKHWYAYAMIAPVALVLGVIVLYPLAYGLYLTLTDADSLNSARRRPSTTDRLPQPITSSRQSSGSA